MPKMEIGRLLYFLLGKGLKRSLKERILEMELAIFTESWGSKLNIPGSASGGCWLFEHVPGSGFLVVGREFFRDALQ